MGEGKGREIKQKGQSEKDHESVCYEKEGKRIVSILFGCQRDFDSMGCLEEEILLYLAQYKLNELTWRTFQ